MKITRMNVDDIIRDERRRLLSEDKDPSKYAFKWGKDGYEALKSFYNALCCPAHGFTCINCFIISEVEIEMEQGMTFMGIKHYWDKRRKDYQLITN